MDYQWYPGHMTKAKRQMQEDIRLIDLIIELIDARIPRSGRNPDIDQLANGKARLVLMNKADLADQSMNEKWLAFFRSQGIEALAIDSRKRNFVKKVQSAVMTACQEKIERNKRRGIKNRPIRAMVAGIPNVGKSTLINSLSGKAAAKTGNRPGVTKGKQWIRLNKNLELLDTPGILWPKFEDDTVGLHLALIGSMNDQILNIDDLALELIDYVILHYPGTLNRKYGIQEEGQPAEILAAVAGARNCVKTGGEPDYDRAASLMMDDFRNGRLGQITLERP